MGADSQKATDVWPGEKSSFRGFDQYNFVLDGVPCKVAVPKTVAAGRPWVWRALFWGNAPQFDVAMLERGYHVVYCHVANLFGNAEAVKRWNAFYDYLRLEHLLSDRVVLEGMSRGGLIVYNWAAANPDKVQAIYADAPVMDFTSWPGGKGKGKGDSRLWEACLKAYGLTEEEAMAFKGHPLDNLAPLAKAGVPIIHVVGDADDVVPVAENTAIAEARYKELGGQFEVIHKKDVGHHPHSLENPQPIVDFVIRQDSAQDKRGHVATGSGRAAELAVAGIFTDGMVLQRGVAVPVWGTAYPGATVTVRFAGQEKNSMVDENGRWMISLDPLKASAEGRTMVISSPDSGSTLQVSDVLVGEVWLVGGQSNAD